MPTASLNLAGGDRSERRPVFTMRKNGGVVFLINTRTGEVREVLRISDLEVIRSDFKTITLDNNVELSVIRPETETGKIILGYLECAYPWRRLINKKSPTKKEMLFRKKFRELFHRIFGRLYW